MLELIDTATIPGAADDTLTLSFERRQKRRQRVRLDSGREAALVLPRGGPLREGDGLRSADGFRVLVRAADESVSTGRAEDRLTLARACYHLGNRHVALQIGEGWVRYRPDHVLDEMLVGLGLRVALEHAPFEPESGAYGAHAGHAQGDEGLDPTHEVHAVA